MPWSGGIAVYVGVAAAGFSISPSVVFAQTPGDEIRTAVELCLNTPDTPTAARTLLTDAGWTTSERARYEALFEAIAVLQFNPDDLDYVLGNAAFMAASVLGNSALGPEQVGAQVDDYTVGLFGLAEGTPYCVLSGPDALLEALPGAAAMLPDLRNTETHAQARFPLDGGGQMIVGHVNPVYLQGLLETAGDLPSFPDADEVEIGPAIAYILLPEAAQ